MKVIDELQRLNKAVSDLEACSRILDRIKAPKHEIERLSLKLIKAKLERDGFESFIIKRNGG